MPQASVLKNKAGLAASKSSSSQTSQQKKPSTIHPHSRMTKSIYAFEEGNKDMKDLLGGKGANLAEMTHLGLPVPPGFTITTEVCAYYLKDLK